jgi:hypothetical protein
MSEPVIHRLVGYRRTSGRVAVEYDIDDWHLGFAKHVAGVRRDDPDAVLCYRLTREQVRAIAEAIGVAVDADSCNFYLEGFAAPAGAAV